MIAKILISPSLDVRIPEINKMLERVSLKNPHPDLFYLDSDQKLGVERAKKIREFLSFKPFQGLGRGVVLEDASILTPEAQNALLKTLEELPEKALFIMGAPNEHSFLPTVLSRCEIVRLQPSRLQAKNDATISTNQDRDADARDDNFKKDIEKLLTADTPERFEYIEKLKDKEEFLKALANYFHQNLASHPSSGNTKFIKELLEAEKWAAHNVNIRAILEYLMLIMPRK